MPQKILTNDVLNEKIIKITLYNEVITIKYFKEKGFKIKVNKDWSEKDVVNAFSLLQGHLLTNVSNIYLDGEKISDGTKLTSIKNKNVHLESYFEKKILSINIVKNTNFYLNTALNVIYSSIDNSINFVNLKSSYREYFNLFFNTFLEMPMNNDNLDNWNSFNKLFITSCNDNKNEKLYNRDFLEYFDSEVAANPNQIAISDTDKNYSYREFNNIVDSLSIDILKKIQDETKPVRIGVYCGRSMESIAAAFAILKTGNCYVPLSVHLPQKRNDYIIQDSKLKLIITSTKNFEMANRFSTSVEILTIQTKLQKNIVAFKKNLSDASEAYCIYTSGTSGKPKGVINSRRGLNNRLLWMADKYKFSKSDMILHKTRLSFDVSLWEIFGWAINGSSCCILPEGKEIDPNYIYELLNLKPISIIHFVPTMADAMYDYLHAEKMKSNEQLRLVFSSGERLVESTANKMQEMFPAASIVNLYGPTEAAIDVTHLEIGRGTNEISIGRPINNIEIQVNNLDGKSCEVGEWGEICITGVGVAIGYTNPEAKGFYQDSLGKKVYKTGDRGKWRADGNIDYKDRIDNQVKINGNRVELAEIEYVAEKVNGVDKAIAIYDHETLALFLKCDDYDTSKAKVKKIIHSQLPNYMYPNLMFCLTSFPLNINGKIDKQILKQRIVKKAPVKRGNSATDILKVALESVLPDENINYSLGFVQNGGDSIKAIQVVSQLVEQGFYLPFRLIISKRKLSDLFEIVKKDTSGHENAEIVGQVENGPILTDFLDRKFENPNHYNMSYKLPVKSLPFIEWQKIVEQLTTHHDMLRAIWNSKHLSIAPTNEYKSSIEEIEVSQINDYQLWCFKEQSTMKLDGNLIKFYVFRNEYGHDQLIMIAHHSIVDGVSWRIISKDILKMSNQVLQNKKLDLPDKTIGYQKWNKELLNYKKNGIPSEIQNYWKQNFAKDECVESASGQFVEKVIKMPNEYFYLLNKVGKESGMQSNEIVLSTLSFIFSKMQIKNTQITVEGHGRENFAELNVTNTVGWFTTMFPFKLPMDQDVVNCFLETKERFRKVPNNGFDFSLLYRTGKMKNILCFNYLGDLSDMGKTFEEIRVYHDFAKENQASLDRIVLDVFSLENNLYFRFQYLSSDNSVVVDVIQELLQSAEILNKFLSSSDGNKTKTLSDISKLTLSNKSIDELNSLF